MRKLKKYELMQTIGERLREIRLEKGLSQKEASDKLHITPAMISSYEKGAKNPSIATVYQLADFYGVSIDWLCGIQEDKFTKMRTDQDIMKFLTALNEAADFKVESRNASNTAIVFNSKSVCAFLRDWNPIRKLYIDGVINKELYDLWINNYFKSR